MSKRLTRVLSLVLTLVMFLSVSTPAFAIGGGDMGRDFGRDIGENEIRDFEPAGEIAEEEELDYFQTTVEANGSQVTVEAPMGALPTLAELRAETVEVEDVREAVESVVEGEANILLAMDISFWLNGIEIEPEEPVRVKISAPELEGMTNLTLVHIPDAAEPETVDLIDESDLSFALGTNEIAFQADSFSVYAVIGGGEGGDEARATVEFYGLNDAKVATYYVKNSDQLPPDDPDARQDNVQYLDEIVVDPGVGGQVPEGQIFVGWYIGQTKDFTTKTVPMTIDKVRVALDGMTVKEGQVIKVWAMIFKVFSVSYMITDSVSIGVDEIYLLPDENSVEYAVSKDYTPEDPTQKFLGWITDNDSVITNAKYNGEDTAEPYKMSTTMTISGSIVFRMSAPHGRWLVFDENGSGATYNAPQFVENGETTEEPPLEMVRLGYQFKGWYTVKYADNETADESNKFNFGGQLTEPSTTIYAKWEVNPSAPYTVIYWKQNVSGEGYDFDKSETATAAPGTPINVTTSGTTISVTGVPSYTIPTGFSYDKHDTGKTVAPQGNTVVNVYIKRNSYTLTFQRYWYGGTVYKTITALYEQPIGNNFPISVNGDTTYRWTPNNSSTFNQVLVYIDVMPAENVVFSRSSSDASTKYMEFYIEALPGQTADRDFGGKHFVKYGATIPAKYNFFTESEDFLTFNGLNKYGSDPAFVNGRADVSSGGTIRLYYTRKEYSVNFHDGIYVDGDGNKLTDYAPQAPWREDDGILFGEDISGYNKNGAKYYAPTSKVPGFVFEGWYIDDACTTPYTFDKMGDASITVYAKWRQIEYRVFLHANAKLPNGDPNGDNDPALTWGSESQKMCFRVPYMGKVANVKGTRGDEYKMIGWFTSDGKPFNMDSSLTEANVTEDYDKTKDFTDPMDKYGDVPEQGATNSDITGWDGKDRYWITKKLVLTAKWSALLPGAEGITIVYDANGGTNAPTESKKYQDNVEALAGTAPTPPQDYRFLYWVVQDWDEEKGEYVDTTTIVYPGAPFTVLKSLSRVSDLPEDQIVGDITKAYTMHLRAQYGPAEITKDTHIDWYINVEGTTAPIHEDKDLQINQAVDIFTLTEGIPTRAGYKFLGWARETQYETDDHGNFTDQTIPYYPDLTESDLYLKWIPASGEGDSAVAAHYEIANGKIVTQVAADEALPYQAFYAVWDYVGLAYIFHSSDATVEIIDFAEMQANNQTIVNLQAKVKDGYLYGGYFTAYFNVTDAQAIAVAGKGTAATEDVYVGNAVYKRIDGKIVRYWNKANAYGEDKPGTSLTPEEGKVYYLREIDDDFLGLQLQLVYDWGITPEGAKGYQIDNLYMITTTDNNIYKEAGFRVKIVDPTDHAVDYFVASFSYESDKVEGSKVVVKAVDLNGIGGFVGVWDSVNDLIKSDKVAKDTTFIVTPYWITPDGVQIFDSASRTFNVGDKSYGSDAACFRAEP